MHTHKRALYKRWWFYLLVLAVALAGFELYLFACVTVNASVLDTPEPADVLIVLGAGIDADGLPKPMLERRLNRAYDLYQAGYGKAVIVTGARGDDEPITEASSMKAYLVAKGLSPDVIFEEDTSYNTKQNLENAQAIMAAQGFQTAVIVSSDYHLWRALSIAGDLGLTATGAGAQNALTTRQGIVNCLQETISWNKYLLMW